RIELALPQQVDEPGSKRAILEVDAAARLASGEIAHGDDGIAANADVRAKPGRARPVDHPAAGEDEIEDGRADQRGHACGATTITPSSPWAPSTTARTGNTWRAMVASSSRAEVTSLAV